MVKTAKSPAFSADLPRYVGEREVYTSMNISRSTLRRMIDDGAFPKAQRLSKGRIGWWADVICDHLVSHSERLVSSDRRRAPSRPKASKARSRCAKMPSAGITMNRARSSSVKAAT
jgi:predicted DNA-binding transcriptional regulator AlpA